jgi:hypothetical protein
MSVEGEYSRLKSPVLNFSTNEDFPTPLSPRITILYDSLAMVDTYI